MKRQILLICFISSFIAANAMINQKDAFAFSEKFSSESNSEIWVSNQQYAKGDTIFLWQGNLICPFESAWCVFIDNYPLANWGHECEYIFVDSSNGACKQYDRTLPPLAISEHWTRHRAYNRSNVTDSARISLFRSYYQGVVSRISNTQSERQNNRTEDSHLYAMIVDYCGSTPYYYRERHSNDCALMYATLRANGYLHDNIYVAMPLHELSWDEPDPYSESESQSGADLPATIDLDGDGVNDVQYDATIGGLNTLFADITQVLTEDDILLVYITGNADLAPTLPNMPPDGFLSNGAYSDFTFMTNLAALNVGTVNFIIQRTWPDYFNENLFGSLWEFTEKIISLDDVKHRTQEEAEIDDYTFRLNSAVNGGDLMSACDLNGDGKISMYEAHTYAIDNCANNLYSPCQNSLPVCLKHDLTIAERLPESQCLSSDLYIKDNSADYGEEPNTSTNLSYISNDIWIEDLSGNVVESIMSNEDYYVCVKIRNRGLSDSNGDEVLHVHWTKAVIGGSWPDSWMTGSLYDCNGTLVTPGGEITQIAGEVLPVIPSGGEYTARIQWRTPDNAAYTACSEFQNNIGQLWHYCLLARVYDENEQPGEDMQSQDMHSFVLNSNNVASVNISIMSETEDPFIGSIVGIVPPFTGIFNITGILRTQIENLLNGILTINLFLDNRLLGNWSGLGNGFMDAGDLLQFTSPVAEISNIYMYGDELHTIKVETENALPGLVFDIMITDETGFVYGGERFKTAEDASLERVLQSGNDMEREENIGFSYAETDLEVIQVTVINALGRIVAQTANIQSIDMNKLPQGTYSIIVYSTDGVNTYKVIR